MFPLLFNKLQPDVLKTNSHDNNVGQKAAIEYKKKDSRVRILNENELKQ